MTENVSRFQTKGQRELSEQFDRLVENAAHIAIVSVTKEGEVQYILSEGPRTNDLAMVGALDITKLAVIDRVFEFDD